MNVVENKLLDTSEYSENRLNEAKKSLKLLSKDPRREEVVAFLKDKLEDPVAEVLKDLDPNFIEKIYRELDSQWKQDVEKLFKAYKAKNKIEKERLKAIDDVLIAVNRELGIIDAVVVQSAYTSQNLLKSEKEHTKIQSLNSGSEEIKISDAEMISLDKILNAQTINEWKLSKVERALKSDFRRAIVLLKENTDLSLKGYFSELYTLLTNYKWNPDWNKLFPKNDAKNWTEREQITLTKAYDAYIEAKKRNPNLSRWNQIIGMLEVGLLNEGKNLDIIYTESLNTPIAKKERKSSLKDERDNYISSLEGDDDEQKKLWMNNYIKDENNQKHLNQLRQSWLDQGYRGGELSHMTKEYIEDQFDRYTKKEWKKELKEMEKEWIQHSDLGKFSNLVDKISENEVDEKIKILMTDTNFDGIRDHLDGLWVKRGQQVDASLHQALSSDRTIEQVVSNVQDYMKLRLPGVKDLPEKKNPQEFYQWMSDDIRNARNVQMVLMDSPANALDIFMHGKDALTKTMEKQKLPSEATQLINNKIDKELGGLSSAGKGVLMSQLSSYLLNHMQSVDPSTSLNGLWIGSNIPLSQILDGLSFNLWVGTDLEWGKFAGVGLSWNEKIAKWETGAVSAGAKVGTSLGVVPIYGLRAGINQDINTKEVLWSIDSKAVQSVHFGANVTMIGVLPSRGLGVWFDKNQIRGIEMQYQNIKKDATELFNDILKWEAKEEEIRIILEKKYKKSDSESIGKAAENILAVLNTLPEDAENKKEYAWIIGEWYAESWKNNAVQNLPKGWKPTGAAMGIQFLAGFFPVGSLSMTLTKYHNESYEDTPESKQKLRQRMDKGIWNEKESQISDKHFEQITKDLQHAKILSKGESLKLKDGYVVIPRSLFQRVGITILINPELKKYVQNDEDNDNYRFPADTDYRFLSNHGATGSSFVLNIGGNSNTGMEKISPDFFGDKNYELDKHQEKLENTFNSFIEKNPDLENLSIRIDENKNILFSSWGESIHEKIFSLEEGWTFSFKKNENWTTEVERLKDSENKDWKISFFYNKASESKSFEFDNKGVEILEKLKDKDSDLVKAISSLDNNDLTMLEWFLKNTGAAENNYDEAAKLILKALPDNPILKDLKYFLEYRFDDVGTKLTSHLKKVWHLVLDRIKAIFATETNIKDMNSLKSVVNQRNNVYQTLKWPNGKTLESLGINIDSKAFVENRFKVPSDLEYVSNPELIGFTAFYRKGTNEGRGLSLTALGETNVLGGHMMSLKWAQRTAAEEWFWGKKDSSGKKISSGNLEKYRVQEAEIYRKVREVVGEPSLSDDLIKELFQWKGVDIWGKMVKLDFEYVFYLLAECANESIGLNIKGIQIFDKESVSMKKEGGSMTFNRSEGIAGGNVESSKIDVWVAFGGGSIDEEDLGEGGKTEQEWGTWEWTWDGGDKEGWSTDQSWNTWEWTWGNGTSEGTGGGGR